jgi:hypothetical protein
MRKALLFLLATLCLGTSAAAPAFASHESNNALTFAAVAGSPSPTASGTGIVNYVKGRSTEEPDTAWTSSFHFAGLAPDTTYTVFIFGRGAICSFTTNANGRGGCESTFIGLPRFGVAQLRLGGAAGTPVLQATRQGVVPGGGPGEIVSRGDCRDADQELSLCDAPGRG